MNITADKTGTFVNVALEVENLGKEAHSLSPLELIGSDGAKFSMLDNTYAFEEIHNPVYSIVDRINPGLKKQYSAIFEVPQGAQGFKINLPDMASLFGSGEIVDLPLTSTPQVSRSRHSTRKTENTATDNGDGTVTLNRGEAADE